MFRFCLFTVTFSLLVFWQQAPAAPVKVPTGLFKDVNDTTIGQARLVRGTQLFIDDWLIESLEGVRRQLNQPVKHKRNPVLVKDKPWEQSGPGYGTVHYDPEAKLFRMWYQTWKKVPKGAVSEGDLYLATSRDGVTWSKPVINKKTGTNRVQAPRVTGFQCPGIFRDPAEKDPSRRFKMLFSCAPDGTDKTWMTSVGYSPDGIHWTAAKTLPLIPFSDTQICPFWDYRSRRYIAILRFGPPNTRLVSRTESEDFLHWSPKITVIRRTKMDVPQQTQFYQMAPMPYGDVYIGLVAAYHTETLKPIPPDRPWTDRKNLQLVYSRNSISWSRVGSDGAIPHNKLNQPADWARVAREAAFLPYGKKDRDWDWGTVSPYYTPEPIVIKDRIHFYYMGQNGRNWWNYTGDPPRKDPDAREPNKGVGLATLRIDGFVSIEAGSKGGTMTTRPFLFLGDGLILNADARGGQITVEALDAAGKPLEGFGLASSRPLTSDNVRHALSWKGHKDLHQLQGKPIRLRFHLKNARMFSLTPRTQKVHYIRSYN